MTANIGGEILTILLLLVANGVFAMSEIAVVSARRARLQQRADAGDAGARRALALSHAPDRFLATVQVGITLVGILTGAFGGATLAEELALIVRGWGVSPDVADAAALTFVVLCITYLSLIVGELVPKRIGLRYPESIAARVAGPMGLLSRVAAPAVWVLSASTDVVLRVLRLRASDEKPVTEAEIAVLLEEGTEAGVIEPKERELVGRVFRLGDLRVDAVMTPRHRLAWLDVSAPFDEARETMCDICYARYLVCDGELDAIVGVVEVKDLFAAELAGEPVRDLRRAVKPPLVIPASLRALKLLERFRESGMHVAVVVDEYGGVEGLVTLNDLLGELTGDLAAGDATEGVVRRDDGSYLVDGSLPMDDLRAVLHIAVQPGEGREYRTLAGWVFTALGRVPREGEYFDADGHRIEVIDMDGNRIDKVLVRPTP